METFTTLTSKVVLLPVDDIDTDQIIPARYLKTTDKTGLGNNLFSDWRYNPDGSPRSDFVLNQPGAKGSQLLFAGRNFGCGSSREHAPWALRAWGIRAIFSTSFADIFKGNALKNALLPIEVTPERYAALTALVAASPDGEWTVDLQTQKVSLPDGTSFSFEVDPFARKMILAGTDEVGYVLSQLPAIEAWEAAHPARVETREGAAAR